MKLILTILSILTLVSCTGGQGPAPATFDLVAETLPFPRPAIERLDSLSGVPPLPDGTRAVLDLRRAFFAGDFARLDAALTEAHDQYVNGHDQESMAADVVWSLRDTVLAGIDTCADWLRTMPDSYVAHWWCGEMWNNGAVAARGHKYASEVSPGQFALMRERLQRSNALLERALTLTPKPVEALTRLADNSYLDGERPRAEAYLERAEAILPQHAGIYYVRMNFALPEWGGSQKQELAWLERARTAGVSEDVLLFLEDEYVARPAKMSTPGAPRAYWEAAIRKHPTRTRLKGLLQDFVGLQNWHDALPVAERLIKEYPEEKAGYFQRAVINQNLGRIPQARDDYRMAAAMGHDYALQALLLAHIRGGLGLPGRSFEGVAELCRFGATLGSPVGTNCMGASFDEGGPGMPFPKDVPQSFAWHLMGARAGHYNSQYDLGWLLFTGRGPGVSAAAGKRIGTFWLRRAAEQGHIFAKRKLEENRISPSEALPVEDPVVAVLESVVAGLRELFTGR